MVVDHTSHIGFPPRNRGILVVCARLGMTRDERVFEIL
jgi:hypothetical protein